MLVDAFVEEWLQLIRSIVAICSKMHIEWHREPDFEKKYRKMYGEYEYFV